MDIAQKKRRPKVGVFVIGSPRFKNLGEGTAHGTYEERKRREVQPFLGSLAEQWEVCFPGIIYEREDVYRALLQFAQENVDLVLAMFLSWAEDFSWIRFLRDAPDLPIVFYSPVKDHYPYSTTENDDDFIEFLAAGGLVGASVGSGSIRRFGRKVKVVVGDQDALRARLQTFGPAAKARNVLRQSQFGLLGNYNELMWATYLDPYRIFSRVGPELRFIPYSELQETTAAISDSQAAAYVEELRSRYSVDENVDPAKFLESARASMGMAHIVTERGLDALALNDVDVNLFKLMGLRPGFYHPSIEETHSIAVPEGDLGGALITFVLKLMTGDHVNFIEPFYVEGASGRFAAGHAGPNDHTDPKYQEYVKIAIDVRFAKTSFRYAGSPFAWYRIPPGMKTIAHLSQCNDNFKLVCFKAESLEGKHFLNSYSHSMFQPTLQVCELFERTIAAGTTQHFSLVAGDHCNALRDFAELCHFDFHYIG